MSNKKVVLVTGAGKGIGRGISYLLSNSGYKVIGLGLETTLLEVSSTE